MMGRTKTQPSFYTKKAQERKQELAQTVNAIKAEVTAPMPEEPREAAVVPDPEPAPVSPSEIAVAQDTAPAPEPVSEIKTYGRPKVYNSENPRTTTTLVLTADRKRKLQIYAIKHDTNISGVISEFIDTLPDV